MNFTADKLRKLSDKQLDKLSGAILTEKHRRNKELKERDIAAYLASHPEIRQDGYETGRRWDASWTPGGPNHPLANQLWQAGFKEGLEQNLKINPDFAKWREGFKQRGEYHRYNGEIN